MNITLPTFEKNLQLIVPWQVNIIHYYKNLKILKIIGALPENAIRNMKDTSSAFTFPIGTILEIQSITMKKDGSNDKPVFLNILESPNSILNKSKIVVSIEDFKKIEFEEVEKPLVIKKPKKVKVEQSNENNDWEDF